MPLSRAHQKLVFKSRFSQISPQGNILPPESDRKVLFQRLFLKAFLLDYKVQSKKKDSRDRKEAFKVPDRFQTRKMVRAFDQIRQ